ncbi:MAG: tetratricopeptide repeat protein [Deltaproteobacteria bacterium]|nr:tetratricopeptide repeat protein [Deltaproteobacteria bacterium]MBW2668938.1 tetratricopeptide repeat protein [Deltaproteobacteria bacterium]
MAKKRISRARKRDLANPDEFITFWTKLSNFAAENKVKALCALGFFMVLIVVTAGFLYFLKKSEDTAFALLQQNITKYQTLLKDTGPEKACLGVEKDFQSIIEKYSGRAGGKHARLIYANICYTAKDYDEAIELYKKSLEDFNDEPFIKNLIINSLGYSYTVKKDYKTAAKYFEMIASIPNYSIKDEALFNLGEIYNAMGDNVKSIDAFKKILSDHTGSIYTEIAQEKLAGRIQS